MINSDVKSNAQPWELEVACKNKKYLDAVVMAILKYGMINFEVENIECLSNANDWDGRYLVLMWCCWFSNLKPLVEDLAQIEKDFEGK